MANYCRAVTKSPRGTPTTNWSTNVGPDPDTDTMAQNDAFLPKKKDPQPSFRRSWERYGIYYYKLKLPTPEILK
jgi:hypothetical protein